jgi:type IV pilus assembly protein PilE
MKRRTPRARTHGFTLIELMVVVVIAAVLLAIAIPTYTSQIRKSRRTDAKTALLDLAGREERYFAINNAYTATATSLGYSGFGSGYPIGGGYYYLSAPTVTAATSTTPATFTLTAVPVSGAGQDKDTTCAEFMVYSSGQQYAQSSSGTNTTTTCWP